MLLARYASYREGQGTRNELDVYVLAGSHSTDGRTDENRKPGPDSVVSQVAEPKPQTPNARLNVTTVPWPACAVAALLRTGTGWLALAPG